MSENEYDDVFEAAARDFGVDADVLKGIAYAESRFRPDIIQGKTRSPKGATGLMQFMPETAKEYGIDPTNPVESIAAAAIYLRRSLDKFGGDYSKAVASYNWGPNRQAFQRDDWVKSLPTETSNYVGTVFGYADKRASTRRPPAAPEAPAPKEEDVGLVRRAGDVPVLAAQGFATGFRLVADAFGADNPLSQSIKGVEKYLGDLASAEAQGNQQRMAEILAEAEGKGVLDQVKIALRAASEAPVELLSQAFGTIGATVLASVAGKVIGTSAAVARGAGAAQALQAGVRGQKIAGGVTGVGMGLGTGKGAIYEAVKEELMKVPGVSEQQAEAVAQEAQSYGGENLDQIALSGLLGGVSALAGADPRLANLISNRVLRRIGDRAAQEAGGAAAKTPGVISSTLRGGATEFATEFPQGAQEQVAANVALQREGFDRPTFDSAVAAGTVEGVAGFGVGAGAGALSTPRRGAAERPDPELEIPQRETPPEVATLPPGTFTEQDIEAASEGIPASNLPTVRREVLGKTPEQLRAFVDENPEILEDDSPTARIIRALLEPAGERDQSGMGIPVPSAGEPGVPGAQPAIPPERGGVAGPAADVAAPIPTTPSPTPTVTETPSGITTPEAIEAEAQRPQEPTVDELTAPVIEEVEPPATPEQSWNLMTPETRQRVAEQAGVRQPENFGNKRWGSLSKANREKLAGSMLTAETEPTTSMPGKRVESEEEAEAMEAMMALERRGNQIRRDDKSLISKLRGIGLTAGDLKDVYGRKVPIYAQNLRAKGKPGTDLSSLVADGILDDWLPFNMRLGMSGFDEQAGVEYIKQRLMQQDYLTEEAKMALREVDLSMQDLEQVLRLEDINAELDLAAQEQRESGPTVEEDTAPTEDRDTERTQASQDLRRRADAARAAAAERGVDVDAITEEVDAETRGQDDDAFRQRLIERLEAAPDLELTPPTPEAQAEADRRAEQAPAEQEREQIRRESEVGAGQFRLEGGEGRQDISGTLFQQEGGIGLMEIEGLRRVKAGDVVDGRVVRKQVPNMDSIESSLDNYRVLDGVREVPMSAFDPEYVQSIVPERLDKRTRDLVEKIKESGELNPLIVAFDSKGAYIIEGGHRFDALIASGAQSIPAVVVIDESSPPTSRQNLEEQEGKLQQRTEQGGWAIDPEEQKLEKELKGKDFMQVAQWAVDNAPNAFAKTIATKVQARLKEFQRRGVVLDFRLHTGDRRPLMMSNARGSMNWSAAKDKPLSLTLNLNGAAAIENQSGYPPGMRYQTILHELIHGATAVQIYFMKDSPLVKQLNDLRNTVVKEFNARQKKGTLTPFEQKIYNRSINALSNNDEVLAWGLTDRDMQEFMADIKVGEQSLFDKFVEIIQKILNLGRPYRSALEDLIRTGDALLDISTDDIAGAVEQKYLFGPADPRIDTTEMVQGTLFQQESATPEPVREVQQSPNIQREAETIEQKAARENIFGEGVLSTWNTPTDTKLLGMDKDNIIYRLQNKQIDLKRVIDAIREKRKDIGAKWDAYLQETLYHGRTAKRTQDYLKNELEKQVELMQKYGLTKEEVGTYLHNRHAEEANIHIAERNPDRFPDGGSGIKTADARAYLAALKPEKRKQLEQVSKLIDDSVRTMQDELVRDGLESVDTINTWREMFQFYIPLNRVDTDFDTHSAMTQGAGYSTSGGTARSRTGSEKEVAAGEILANLAMQRERAIVRGEKNRVSNALFGLVLKNPNPDVWLALDPSTDPVWKSLRLEQELRNELAQLNALLESGNVDANQVARYQREIDLTSKLLAKETKKAASALEKVKEQFRDMGLKESDVRDIMMPPMQARYDKVRNKVVYEPNASIRNRYILATRINGQEKYVLFNANNPRARRMAEALKNMDGQQLGQALNIMAKITRWMAAVNTQYNPVFGAYNFLRDVQTGLLQINDTPIADKKSEVVAGTMPALKAIYQSTRKRRKGEKIQGEGWPGLWEEFQNEGGQTGFRDVFSQSDERAAAIQRMIDPSTWADSPLGKVFTAGGTLKMPLEQARKVAAPIFDWLSDYNDTMENAIRLSAYKAAKDKFIGEGMSATDAKQRAAAIAKDLTVNFNRKGQIANQAGAMYAFFNASVQGTTRMFQLLNSPIGRKIAAGAFLLGVLQAVTLAAAGFDDEEPQDFVKQRNYIIPTGDGNYKAFPMPLGFNVLPNTARVITEWALSGFKDTSRRVAQITDAMFDMFNPVGNAGWSYQSISPTAFDPLVALAENKDWTGQKIAREDFSKLDPTPGYTRSRDNANWLTQNVAEFLNTVSGGDQERKGFISPTSEQLDYLIGQAFGGVGREALKTMKTGQAIVNDEELPSYNVPLFGRFYGNVTGMAPVSNKFYRNMTELNIHKRAIERLAEEGGDVRGYLEKNPEAVLHKAAGTQYREVQKLRKARLEFLNKGDKANAKRLEEQIKTRMDNLNKLFDEKRK